MDVTTRSSAGRRWWLLQGVLALLFVAFGLAAGSSPAGQALAGARGPLLTSASTDTASPTSVPTGTFTPTNTPTAAPPTATAIITRTATPTCTPSGMFVTATATLVPGVTDIGNHCDDCETAITLPFPFQLYDGTFTTAWINANGYLHFTAGGGSLSCLPIANARYILLPLGDDLETVTGLPGCSAFASGCGVFTSVSGSTPNRVFNIEWRAVYFATPSDAANFEVRLYEGSLSFDFIYGHSSTNGAGAVVGAQGDECHYAQYTCGGGGLSQGLILTLSTSPPSTVTPTPTPSSTATPLCGAFDLLSTDVPQTFCGLCTITSHLDVSGLGTIDDLDLIHLGISTTTNVNNNHFYMSLTTPGGVLRYLVMSDQCLPSSVFAFDDEAPGPLTCPPGSEPTYRSFERLSGFDGYSANGTWVLHITAGTPLDRPTLNSWGLRITTDPCASPSSTTTPTPTPTQTSLLDGHVTWDGPPPQPDPGQQLPISLTLRLVSGGPNIEYPFENTDSNGHFVVSVAGLPNGDYYWRAKGPNYLANSGTLTLTGAPLTQVEMGVMLPGDANGDNVVNVNDFTIVKSAFGRGCGDFGYDGRADFTNDCLVNVVDFTLLKLNFGHSGAPPFP